MGHFTVFGSFEDSNSMFKKKKKKKAQQVNKITTVFFAGISFTLYGKLVLALLSEYYCEYNILGGMCFCNCAVIHTLFGWVFSVI